MITLSDLKYQNAVVDETFIEAVDSLHPQVHATVTHHRQVWRENVSKGQLLNVLQGDYVLVAREDFAAGERLCLR